MTDEQASWRDVAAAADVRGPGRWLSASVGSMPIAIALVDGAYYAVADACTHAGCPFSEEADLDGTTIICNCHGSEFDLLTGSVRHGPAERPVRTFPVREREGRLEVQG
jgi:nitrite reductase/ring-hydroxylating ferredoxin subunit